jgi:hypothetical protein
MSRVKSNTIISGIFALYLIASVLFLNPFSITGTVHGQLLPIGILVVTFLINFLILSIPQRMVGELIFITRVASFPITSLICGLTIWFVHFSNKQHFGNFIAAFLFSSLLPTVIFIFYRLLSQMEKTIVIQAGPSIEEKDQIESKIHDQAMLLEPRFILTNDQGSEIFNTEVSRIGLFEANDNYVIIHYVNEEDQLKKNMERISLRKIEGMLKDSSIHFERVHKSYLVNPKMVTSVEGRSQAYKLKLDKWEHRIPVSRSYEIQRLKQ